MSKVFSIAKRVAIFLVILISFAANCPARTIINHANDTSNYSNRNNALSKQSGDTLKVGMVLEGINTSKAGKITFTYKYDASINKAMPVSKRLIVVNGKAIEPGTIGGLEGSDYILMLAGDEGFKKYGKRVESGVIEANGPKITLLSVPPPPPSGPPPLYE